jgi:hypothetical protein
MTRHGKDQLCELLDYRWRKERILFGFSDDHPADCLVLAARTRTRVPAFAWVEIPLTAIEAAWPQRGGVLDLMLEAAQRAVTMLSPWAGKLRRIATRALAQRVGERWHPCAI